MVSKQKCFQDMRLIAIKLTGERDLLRGGEQEPDGLFW
jgi:hypothetical protein